MSKFVFEVSVRLLMSFWLVWSISGCQSEVAEISKNNFEINPDKAEFIGSERCGSCHQQQFQEWQQSHHFQSMRASDDDSVLADFSDVKITVHQSTYRFYKKSAGSENSYWVAITEQTEQETHYEISYTFGFYPLQQYLVEFDNGHIQALNLAWDSRAIEDGGQRWFHLRPDETMSKDNIFHWQRHYQNWNSRCADCHSTGLEKNYNVDEHSYATQWAEVNVACEACHGEGSEHLRLAQAQLLDDENNGFAISQQASLDWYFRDNAPIASPVPNNQTQSNEIDMCGACHSLRSNLASNDKSTGYHDGHRVQVIDDNTYFPDGQIKQETFVLGSFLQSKMHANGVTCANCHNTHTGSVLVEGNGLCLQCHSLAVYDTPEHHQHEADSIGAQCVNCHMPARTYMQVDDRRDHSFVVPNAQVSSVTGSPNPCLTCHQDKNDTWLKNNIKTTVTEHWSLTKHQFLEGETDLVSLKNAIDSDQPIMRKAGLLAALARSPSQQSFDIAKSQLNNQEPLLRRAALSSLIDMPISVVLPNALKLIDDPIRSVRFEALSLLLSSYQQLSEKDKQEIAKTLDEYQQSLAINADSPEGQLAIANFALSQSDFEAVEEAYQRALKIEPNHIPTLINFADFYRASNREQLGRGLLEQAIALEPKHSSANFAYGMALIRNQNKELALQHLQIAAAQQSSVAYYHYVYAVGLNDLGQKGQARDVVAAALSRWPKDDGLFELSQQLR